MVSTMCKGALMSLLEKLAIVINSPTETEIILKGECMPKCMRYRYFGLVQSESTLENFLLQDNNSCMLLEKNWPFSPRKGSKHINVCYKIKNKEVKLVFCPTMKILAGYQSKPTEEKLFTDHRNIIMGVRPEDFDRYKRVYVEVLKCNGLSVDEKNLFDIPIHRSVLGISYWEMDDGRTHLHV